MTDQETSLLRVRSVLAETLGISERASSMSASTELFGSLPELDSLAVLELVTAIEDEFDIAIDDSDFSGETFDTLGSLALLVDSKLASAR